MSVVDSLAAVAETLRISAPTVVEAAVGRLTLEACDARLEAWSKKIVERIARIDLRVGGAQPDWSRPYVVMSNHQSHLDIPVLFRVVRGRLRMVTKTELFQVPIWGRAMREAGFIEIDRGKRDAAVSSLKVAEKMLADGTHVWIAPEGTRSKDGRIGPLKKGGFAVAKATGLAILPVAIRGTIDVLPRGTARMRRGQRVDVIVGSPLDVANRDVGELMAAVQSFFATHVEQAARPKA